MTVDSIQPETNKILLYMNLYSKKNKVHAIERFTALKSEIDVKIAESSTIIDELSLENSMYKESIKDINKKIETNNNVLNAVSRFRNNLSNLFK